MTSYSILCIITRLEYINAYAHLKQHKMIVDTENYNDTPTRTAIKLQCDYCGKIFLRTKKDRKKLNKNLDKDSCGDKECSAKKKKETNIKLFGTEHYFQSDKFQKQSETTNLLKFGSSKYFNSDDFATKRKRTMKSKYGVENPMQDSDIQKKQQKTCLERYGVDNYAKTQEFADREISEQTEMSKAKRQATCLSKYGKISFAQTDEYWAGRIKTCQDKFGTDHPHQNEEVRAKFIQTMLDKYGVENYAQTEEFKTKYKQLCMERYGVPNPLCLQDNRQYGKAQQELADWINSFGFNFKTDYSILDGKELDLYDPSLKLAIEYCGLFWHTELSPQPRTRNYHYEKYKKCLKKGIRLITIFEDEWKYRRPQCENILKSILGIQDKTFYARNCDVKEVIDSNFFEQYHIQGHGRLTIITFGLWENNELIGAMSLGRHHRKSKDLVLDRLCFANGIRIVGGASKLFSVCKKWAKMHGYDKIITWSDNRWSAGNVYPQMGFALDANLPQDYSYVELSKPYKRISKQSQKKSTVKCPVGKTEKEFATERGLARIWDCGKKRWLINL